MVNITINGNAIQVPSGTTVLRAAEQAGITIPTLCDHPDLHPFGGCRLCVVEVQGARLPMASCTLPVNEGMVVTTESPALTKSRRTILELLMSNYYDSGYKDGQKETTQFMRWVKHYGISVKKAQAPAPRYPVNSDPNPVIWVDMNKCILCTRCVRACAEIQGRFVWSQGGRGFNTRIVAGAETTMLEARCETCGACVAFCPTGALDNRLSMGAGKPSTVVTTTCAYCGVGCQIDLNVKDNHIIRVTSNPDASVNGMAMCVKGRYGYDYVHHPERLSKPQVRRYLLKGEPKPKASAGANPGENSDPLWDWVETDWDTALRITAEKIAQARDQHGADSVGVLTSAKCTNEVNYLMNKFTRQVVGTNNIDHCARL